MSLRYECPLCFQDVEKKLWDDDRAIHCHQTASGHAHSQDTNLSGSLGRERIPSSYRDTLKARGRARVVSLAGATRCGKACFEYSLARHTEFPDPGNPLLYGCFPREWQVWIDIPAACAPCHNKLKIAMESMFVGGLLPSRTVLMRKALGYPIVFSRKGNGLLARDRASILLIQDIAGESFRKADAIAVVESVSAAHLRFTDDILFLVDSMELPHIYPEFMAFLNVIQTVLSRRGERLNLQKVNFYLVLSMIDKAKGVPEMRDLYQIATSPPYRLPASRDMKDFQEYLKTMEKVHNELQKYVETKAPRLYGAVNATFGKERVRYCVLSSLGCSPFSLEKGGDLFEGILPVQPEPLRVVDPILWILKEDGFL